MRWSYKTVHYEFKKEGLLGTAFIDESEIEESLNEFGRAGWELISMMDMRDGVIAVFKQPLSSSAPEAYDEPVEDVEEIHEEPESHSFSYLPAQEIGYDDAVSEDFSSAEELTGAEEQYVAELHNNLEVEEAYEEDDSNESDTEIGAIRIE